jgi:RsiW-degrading membrane proteinase PrsW (M82 family)
MQTQKTLIEQMVAFFLSAFHYPGLSWKLVFIAILLGLVFGAIWLSAYRPSFKRNPALLVICTVSAFLTWAAIAFVQIPLQTWSGQALGFFFSPVTLSKWLLLVSVPGILLSGIVQEAAKLVPVIFFWISNHRSLTPKLGLIAGAVSGTGFGVFEAVWVHNSMFAAGWTWQIVRANGLIGLAGFWERLFAVGFHIAVAGLSGYGLARGKGWQFYIIAAFLHGALNYSVVLLQKGVFNTTGIEIYAAIFAAALTAVVLWLRWKKDDEGMNEIPEQDSSVSG